MENNTSRDHFFRWISYSDRFFYAALKLEEVTRKGEEIWKEEMGKSNLKPGISEITQITEELEETERDRGCHHIYPYLYCHSLELLLKGLARAFSISITFKNNNHSLEDLFEGLKEYITPIPFEIVEVKKMLSKLDGIYWAQRYPSAQNDNVFNGSLKHLTRDYEGEDYFSDNMGEIFDQYKETFMKLRHHIITHEKVKKLIVPVILSDVKVS